MNQDKDLLVETLDKFVESLDAQQKMLDAISKIVSRLSEDQLEIARQLGRTVSTVLELADIQNKLIKSLK